MRKNSAKWNGFADNNYEKNALYNTVDEMYTFFNKQVLLVALFYLGNLKQSNSVKYNFLLFFTKKILFRFLFVKKCIFLTLAVIATHRVTALQNRWKKAMF